MADRLLAARVVTPEGMTGPGAVVVEDGVVSAVEPASGPVPDRTLVPGFVDLQVNGLDDVDVADADHAGWERLDQLLLASGVTAWCPTLVTAPMDSYGPRLEAIAEAAARPAVARPHIAGAHLEGPFLGGRPGAHQVELLRPVDLGWLSSLPPVVRVVTLAPELASVGEAIRLLVGRGVAVSIGHTAASAEQMKAAVDAGATLVTHLYNGMPPLHHRDPGVVGAALLHDRLTVCVIADLVHVHPAAIALAFRVKPVGRVALVTDSVATARDQRVRLVDGAVRLDDGTLAGSALTMDRAVANVVRHAGVGLVEAVRAASTTPAAVVGLVDGGRLDVGCRADIVALSPELTVEATWVAGHEVYAR